MRQISATGARETFLKDVKRQRKAMKIPQKVLAHELKISQAAYSFIEDGATDLKLETFIFLCERLQLKPAIYFI